MSTSASGNYGVVTAAAAGGVNLEDLTIHHEGTSATRTAGIRINSDGTVTQIRTFQEVALNPLTDWIIPNGAASSSYEVRITNLVWATKDEGFSISPSGSDSDGDEDTWYDLSVDRTWVFIDNDSDAVLGIQDATFDMEIRRGGNILATAAMDWFVNSDAAGGGGGGGCFLYGTEFRMADGSLKEVQAIVPGDIMEEGGRVYQQQIGDARDEYWFNVDGVIVTGTHTMRKDGIWMHVEDAGYPVVKGADTYYIVSNNHHKMVAANGQTFTDYSEVEYQSTGWDDWVLLKLNGKSDDAAMREAIKATQS